MSDGAIRRWQFAEYGLQATGFDELWQNAGVKWEEDLSLLS